MRRPNRVTQPDGRVVHVLAPHTYRAQTFLRVMDSVTGMPTDAERKQVRKLRAAGVPWTEAAETIVAQRVAEQAARIAAMADGEIHGALDAVAVSFCRDTKASKLYRDQLTREQDRRHNATVGAR